MSGKSKCIIDPALCIKEAILYSGINDVDHISDEVLATS
jgi:hypothetical protein